MSVFCFYFIKLHLEGGTMATLICPCPAPWNLWVFRFRGKEESRLQKELRLLVGWPWDREISLTYPGGPNVITRDLKSGRGSRRESRGQRGENRSLAAFEKGERSRETRNVGSGLWKLDKEVDSFLGPPGGTQPSPSLDSSSATPMSTWISNL